MNIHFLLLFFNDSKQNVKSCGIPFIFNSSGLIPSGASSLWEFQGLFLSKMLVRINGETIIFFSAIEDPSYLKRIRKNNFGIFKLTEVTLLRSKSV